MPRRSNEEELKHLLRDGTLSMQLSLVGSEEILHFVQDDTLGYLARDFSSVPSVPSDPYPRQRNKPPRPEEGQPRGLLARGVAHAPTWGSTAVYGRRRARRVSISNVTPQRWMATELHDTTTLSARPAVAILRHDGLFYTNQTLFSKTEAGSNIIYYRFVVGATALILPYSLYGCTDLFTVEIHPTLSSKKQLRGSRCCCYGCWEYCCYD